MNQVHKKAYTKILPSTSEHIIIYIGGYGRSGSTILDILLQNSGAGSFGALSNLPLWMASDLLCSCGKNISECEIWLEQHTSLREDFIDTKIFNAFDNCFISDADVINVNNFYLKLFNMRDHNGYIVDSSKTTYDTFLRPVRLSKIFDVYFIHIIRNPFEIAKSAYKGAGSPERTRRIKNKSFQFVKALIMSTITNFYTFIAYRLYFGRKYIKINFRAFQDNPKAQLQEISLITGLDISKVIKKLDNKDELSITHMLGGNRLRFSKSITFGSQNVFK